MYVDEVYDESSRHRITAVPMDGAGAVRYYVPADWERGPWLVQRYELLYVE